MRRMKVAELILKYVQALTWPFVVAALAWHWRRQLASAIGRLSRIETPAGSVEFAQGVLAAREAADEVAEESAAQPVPETGPGLPGAEASDMAQADLSEDQRTVHTRVISNLMRMSQLLRRERMGAAGSINPQRRRLAVARSWTIVQSAVEQIALVLAPQANRPVEGWQSEAGRDQLKNCLLPSVLQLFSSLDQAQLRSYAAGEEVDRAEAVTFVRSCEALLSALRDAAAGGPRQT
ncbi:hypothetical protein AB0904_27810 [Streptomyces sp. NPDC006684]|uniref:hypothetical protein n=1 Tax=Streptomyces sp. NPDC006684 TaxID=3154477 RepID=UPI003454AA60